MKKKFVVVVVEFVAEGVSLIYLPCCHPFLMGPKMKRKKI